MADFVASDLVKEFQNGDDTLRILDGVTVELNRGDNLAVVGPSGSGKSTFLHVAGTLEFPTSGSIELLGENPSSKSERELAQFRNEKIGFVFQEHHLLPQLTALENVLVPLLANGTVSKAQSDHGKSLLKSVGLAERMHHRPGRLSGGERQRVAVARSLITNPVLMLADEPTGSLDPKTADAIGELLLHLHKTQNTILICVTHSQKLAESFDKKARLENGKFV